MEIAININSPQDITGRARTSWPLAVVQKLWAALVKLGTNRQVVRFSLVTLNVLLLVGIGTFAFNSTQADRILNQSLVAASDETSDPLDQLSSADVAVNAAKALELPETPGVINQAQSVNAELTIAPADTTVVAKPQTVATKFASSKDIKSYVVQQGDNVTTVAAKFSITSDSVMWSNNLNGNSLRAGVTLVIPPVNGLVYTVRSGDTIDSLAQKYRANKEQLIAVNDVELTGLAVGQQILIPGGTQPAPSFTARAIAAVYGPYNGYDYGFCTWYASNRRAQLGRPVPGNLGNANTWASIAASFGIPTGPTPQAGAVAMKHSRAPGHVGIVESVNADGSFWMSEMNSYGQVSMTDSTPRGGWGVVDWKFISADLVGTYTYIY